MSATDQTAQSVLRLPGFATFWLAQAFSRFGDPITLVALAAITYQLTGSALYTSVAVIVATLPAATFGFFAGGIADAIGLRRAMVLSDVARALLIGAVPIAIAGGQLALAYVLVFAAGMFAAVFNPARISLVPLLVPAEKLTAGNSFVYATDRTVEVLGALAGGLLVATIGRSAFFVDAATFAISAVLLARLEVAGTPTGRVSWSRTWRDAVNALRFIRDSAVLLPNTVFSLVAQISLPVFNGLLAVFVFRRFAPDDPAAGAVRFGIAEAALAAGAVVGALVLPRIARTVKKGQLVVAGFVAVGAGQVLASLAPTFEVLVLFVIAIGVANVAFYVPNISILQEHTPGPLRGSVVGARMSLLSLTWLPITLAAGALADVFVVSTLIGLAGAFTLLVALAAVRIRSISEVP
jgi:MFS family permease